MSRTLLALFLLPAAVQAAEPSPADRAIKEAIDLLEKRIDKLQGEDALKVRGAVSKLQDLLAPREKIGDKPVLTPSLVDFQDNTVNYRGKVVRFKLELDAPNLIDGRTLREFQGGTNGFLYHARGPKGEKMSVRVNVQAVGDCPKAMNGDELIITFECTTGSLVEGNYALTVKRP